MNNVFELEEQSYYEPVDHLVVIDNRKRFEEM